MGLPTFLGYNHVGFGVANIAEAKQFCINVLGLELLREGRIESPGVDEVARQFDVAPGSYVDFAFFRLPDNSQIELVQWTAPNQDTSLPKNSDVGGRHLAISVSDLNAALAYLKQQPGVRVMDIHPRGFAYVTTPFGLYLQVVSVSP